jgi:cation transport ATPase
MSPIAEHPRKSFPPDHSTAQPAVPDHSSRIDHPNHDDPSHEHGGFEWSDLVRVLFVALAAAAVWFHLWEPFHRVSVIGLAAALIGGYPIFKEAWENIIERRMTMELSMTIALVAALAIGEFFTALVITGFVLEANAPIAASLNTAARALSSNSPTMIGRTS